VPSHSSIEEITMNKGAATKSSRVDSDDWGAFLSTFSTEKRGSKVDVELVGPNVGDQPLASSAQLDAIDYDPADKGNDVMISLGGGSGHVIRGVTELWTARNDNGVIVALEFVDQEGVRTIVRL
jgi:Family of unknown function (DUF5335)